MSNITSLCRTMFPFHSVFLCRVPNKRGDSQWCRLKQPSRLIHFGLFRVAGPQENSTQTMPTRSSMIGFGTVSPLEALDIDRWDLSTYELLNTVRCTVIVFYRQAYGRGVVYRCKRVHRLLNRLNRGDIQIFIYYNESGNPRQLQVYSSTHAV